MNTQLFGQIVLNVSFVLYSVQFVPQIIHNFKNKQALSNISILTQFGIFITVLSNIVETIGFGYDWQYAVVAIIYLLGVCIQQLQISIFYKKMPEVVNISFIILFAIAMLAMGSNYHIVYQFADYIGFVVNTIYWVPQIFKNYKQKRFDGFSLGFILIAFIVTCLYITSSFLLSWDLIFKINALIMSPIITVLVIQKFYYR
ncbi:MAG: PQ-loop repeat-containing protein [Francisella endosymbiont of Hyalomma asiaticum]